VLRRLLHKPGAEVLQDSAGRNDPTPACPSGTDKSDKAAQPGVHVGGIHKQLIEKTFQAGIRSGTSLASEGAEQPAEKPP